MIILSFIWPLYPIPFRNKPKMAYSRNLSKMEIMDYQGRFKMIKDYDGLSRTTKDCPGQTRTVMDYTRLDLGLLDYND